MGSIPTIGSMILLPEEAIRWYQEEQRKLTDLEPETPAWTEQYKRVIFLRELCYGKSSN